MLAAANPGSCLLTTSSTAWANPACCWPNIFSRNSQGYSIGLAVNSFSGDSFMLCWAIRESPLRAHHVALEILIEPVQFGEHGAGFACADRLAIQCSDREHFLGA